MLEPVKLKITCTDSSRPNTFISGQDLLCECSFFVMDIIGCLLATNMRDEGVPLCSLCGIHVHVSVDLKYWSCRDEILSH